MLTLQMVQQRRGLRGADSEGGGGRQQRAVLQAPGQGQHPLRDLSQENVGYNPTIFGSNRLQVERNRELRESKKICYLCEDASKNTSAVEKASMIILSFFRLDTDKTFCQNQWSHSRK